MELLGALGGWAWKHRVVLLVFTLLFVVGFLNTFHEDYSDEYDSMVGGRYILEGRLPYRDWFQHHQPGAYVVAAAIQSVTGISFVRFRIGLAVFWFLLSVGSYFLLKARLSSKVLRSRIPLRGRGWGGKGIWSGYLLFLAVGATYFWGHMLLADTLSAYLLVPAYALVVFRLLKKERLEQGDLIFISAYSFLAWWTSLTTTYIIAGLLVYSVIVYGKSLKDLKVLKIVVAPYLVFFLFLFVTGSLKDWYFANVTYNQNYYIYNYPRPIGAPVNPIRYGVVIVNTFVQNYLPAVAGFVSFPLANPLQVTVALAHGIFLLYVVLKREYRLLFPALIFLIFSTSRSNPQALRETDYQSAGYIVLGIFHGVVAAWGLKSLIDEKRQVWSVRMLGGAAFLLIVLFGSASGYSLAAKWLDKMTGKYMGTLPRIYDWPSVAPLLNDIVSKDEYVWVGPFHFKELYYMNAQVPSRYHWFLQHANNSEKIKIELLADFEKTKPLIIIFQRNYAPWGGDASGYNKFFTDFLDREYVLLKGLSYRFVEPKQGNFDLSEDFNIRKDDAANIIERLVTKELVKPL